MSFSVFRKSFSCLECPFLLSPILGQTVKILYRSVSCPVLDLDRLSQPVQSLAKILSLSLCPGTIKELLSLCPENYDCPVLLETLLVIHEKTLFIQKRISPLCDWSVVWICFLYCIRIEQKPGSWAAVAAFRTYNVRYWPLEDKMNWSHVIVQCWKRIATTMGSNGF